MSKKAAESVHAFLQGRPLPEPAARAPSSKEEPMAAPDEVLEDAAAEELAELAEGGDLTATVEEPDPVPEPTGGAGGVARVWASLDLRAWERYERRVSHDVECIVVFTERDRAAVMLLAGTTPVVRIPLATDIPARPADPARVVTRPSGSMLRIV